MSLSKRAQREPQRERDRQTKREKEILFLRHACHAWERENGSGQVGAGGRERGAWGMRERERGAWGMHERERGAAV